MLARKATPGLELRQHSSHIYTWTHSAGIGGLFPACVWKRDGQLYSGLMETRSKNKTFACIWKSRAEETVNGILTETQREFVWYSVRCCHGLFLSSQQNSVSNLSWHWWQYVATPWPVIGPEAVPSRSIKLLKAFHTLSPHVKHLSWIKCISAGSPYKVFVTVQSSGRSSNVAWTVTLLCKRWNAGGGAPDMEQTGIKSKPVPIAGSSGHPPCH